MKKQITLAIAAASFSISLATGAFASDVAKDQWLKACNSSGKPAYCECMAKVMEDTVGFDGSKAMDSGAQAAMQKGTQECVKHMQ